MLWSLRRAITDATVRPFERMEGLRRLFSMLNTKKGDTVFASPFLFLKPYACSYRAN